MSLNIKIETVAYGELPREFSEASSGRMTYEEVSEGIRLTRDDVNAVDFDNIHLLTDSEREVIRQVNMFFALHSHVTEVILRPTY